VHAHRIRGADGVDGHRAIKILASAMEIELHRRRGEQTPKEKPGPKPAGIEGHTVSSISSAASQKQRVRDRALAAQPARVAAFVQRRGPAPLARSRFPRRRPAALSAFSACLTSEVFDQLGRKLSPP
jgi:hypothetical protein